MKLKLPVIHRKKRQQQTGRHAKISGNGNGGKKESGTNANKQLLQDWYLKNKP
jgi:hypothetical protein